MRHFLLLCLLVFISTPAFAEGVPDIAYQTALKTFNKIQINQNPQLSLSKKFLDRKIVDSTGDVIGKADSVVLGEAGQIIGLKGRLKLGGFGSALILDTSKTGLTVTNTSFVLSVTADMLSDNPKDYALDKDVFKKVEGATKAILLDDLMNGTLETGGGRKIAAITDVAFNRYNTDLYALIIKIRGKTISIPAQPYMLKSGSAKPAFLLTDDQADGLEDFIKTSKR